MISVADFSVRGDEQVVLVERVAVHVGSVAVDARAAGRLRLARYRVFYCFFL